MDDSDPTFSTDPSSSAMRARAFTCVFTRSCQSTAVFAEAVMVFPLRAMLTAGQRAGEVSRVIPAVSIARSGKTIMASAKTAVDWQDLVNTQVNARARIALDDGSVLN